MALSETKTPDLNINCSEVELDVQNGPTEGSGFVAREISVCEILSNYSPGWLIYAGLVASAINSSVPSLMGLFLASMLFVLMQFPDPEFYEGTKLWCGLYLGLSFMSPLSYGLKILIFTYAGENLTYNIRNKLYQSVFYKSMSWFDRKERAPGVLVSIMSEDIQEVNSLASETIPCYLEGIFGLVIAVAISFHYSW